MPKKMAYFRRFGLKEPRQLETISDEKCCLYRGKRLYALVITQV